MGQWKDYDQDKLPQMDSRSFAFICGAVFYKLRKLPELSLGRA